MREEDLAQQRDDARRQPPLGLKQPLVGVPPAAERVGLDMRSGDQGETLQHGGAQVVAQPPELRLVHRRLELRARDPVLADALGEVHRRQQVDQCDDDLRRQPGAVCQLPDLARLVEGGHQAGVDAGRQGGERPRRRGERSDAFLCGHGTDLGPPPRL
jgi:hypothetical protein